jgi:uncharacterized protein YkwD
MRRGALSVCVVLLLAFFAAPGAKARLLTRSRVTSTTGDMALVAAINSARTLHLLPKLRIDLRLTRAARSHSLDMLRRDYFGHGNLSARMSRFRVRGRVFAENLDYCSGAISARVTVADWLGSPTHREIMLDASLSRIGVATPVGAFGNSPSATLVTADFAGS